MSKDKIEVSMNVYDIPILVEALEEANKEIERLNNKVEELMELYTTERHCKDDYKAIIKEVRESIENQPSSLVQSEINIIKILDKENI